MISFFHLLLIAASCLWICHVHTSSVVYERYTPINSLNVDDSSDYDQNDDQVVVLRRAAHFLFPSPSHGPLPNRPNDFRHPLPNKRQSFGRKHHWDAFFGRRR